MKKSLVLIMLVIAIVAVSAFSFMACNNNKYAIGVQQATTGEYYIKGDADWEFAGYSNIDCMPFSNGGLAVQAMKNGTVNAVVIDIAPAKELVASIEGIKIIDYPLTSEEYGFGVDKAQPELLASINAIMATEEFATKKAEIFAHYDEGGTPVAIEAKTEQGSDPAKELVVATNAEFNPFEYKEGNKFVGIDMEIAAYFAAKLELELVILDMEFDSVVTSIGKNNVDIAMSGLTITPGRKESVNFTTPYYAEEGVGQVIIVLESDTTFDECKSKEDVEAKLKSL